MKKILKLLKKIFVGYTTPECVGLDIGATAIKMVELVPNSLRISNYSIKSIERNTITSQGYLSDIDKLSIVINEQWSRFKPNFKHVSIAMPYSSIITREMIIPKTKNKFDIDNIIKEQLVQELGIEDIDFDYYILETLESEYKVNVVVAKKEKIEEYQAMIQMTGIDVAAIDIEPFAIQNLFEILLKKHQINKDIILFDVGMNSIKAYLFSNLECIYFTELHVRYYQVFEEYIISQNLEHVIDVEKNFGSELFEVFANNQDSADPELIIDAILQDINRLLQVIKSSILVERNIVISEDFQVCLMGGNSLLPGLSDRIKDIGCSRVFFADDLLKPENYSISRENLIRLISALALATWGHSIG